MKSKIPLIVHVIYRLDFGGLETLLVERINRMPADRYRHAVVCLTYFTEFSKKITRPDVELFALHKPPGLGLITHFKLWTLLRKLRPTIVHTYNLSAIEYGFTAAAAGVPVRVNGSHGREASDPEGKNRKHNFLRRISIPIYDCCYSNSADLRNWNSSVIGVPSAKNRLLNNGIDTAHFKPGKKTPISQLAHFPDGCFVIGTVGRIQDVKNHHGLIDAFIQLLEMMPSHRSALRLAIIGDGPMLPLIREKIASAGISDLVWLPGARTDIADILQAFSVFTLPSLAEGTPGSILEAMASGLPVVATRVGGIPEVVVDNVTGILVPPSDAKALAEALTSYYRRPELAALHGSAGRDRVERHYSMASMLSGYLEMYDALCKAKTNTTEAITTCAE